MLIGSAGNSLVCTDYADLKIIVGDAWNNELLHWMLFRLERTKASPEESMSKLTNREVLKILTLLPKDSVKAPNGFWRTNPGGKTMGAESTKF